MQDYLEDLLDIANDEFDDDLADDYSDINQNRQLSLAIAFRSSVYAIISACWLAYDVVTFPYLPITSR